MSNRVAVGDVVLVRLALLPGMSEEDPSEDEMDQLRLVRNGDAKATDKLLKERKAKTKNDTLTAESLSEEFWLHPRTRKAIVTYVDRMGGGTKTMPSGAPGPTVPTVIGTINLDVKTVGSTVKQPSIGTYPIWAQETFRLANVPFYNEEPDDHHEMDVAFPEPEEGDEKKASSKHQQHSSR